MTADQLIVALFGVFFLLGLRSTLKLRRIHCAEEPPRNRITHAFYYVALVITAAAGFYGFLGVRRVLGFDPIPGVTVVSVVVASAVLLIPVFLEWTVNRIQQGDA